MADARVSESSPSSNYGQSTYLRIRSAQLASYRTFFKFNLAGVSGTIVDAELRLFAYDGSDSAGSVYTVSNDYVSGGPWQEDGLTWDNAPGIGGSPLDTPGNVPNGTWAVYDVTGGTSGGVVSFGITTDSSDSAYFHADESTNANKPELIITIAP